jgi:transposase
MSEEKAFRNWIDKIAKSIPGFKGYYKKEERRETDQLLREKIAKKLKDIKDILNEKGRKVTKSGDLSLLDEIARIDKKLEKLTDSIQYANYGYSGFFDQKEISLDTLRSIYEADLNLTEWVKSFTNNSTSDSDLSEISKEIATGFDLLEKRSKIIEGD